MRISLTTTCGVSSSSAVSASRAEANVLNAMFSRARAFSKTHRIERSSSIIQTGFISSPLVRFFYRQQDREDGLARRAFESDGSVVLRDEILCEGEAQATAAFPPRHERIENALTDAFRYAR